MTGDHLEWQLTVPPGPQEQEASILLNLRPAQDPTQALRGVLEYNELAWLSPAPNSSEGILDLDELRRIFPDYFPMPWFAGKARVHPAYPTISLAGTPRTGMSSASIPLPRELDIHPNAWNGYSRKRGCTSLHSSVGYKGMVQRTFSEQRTGCDVRSLIRLVGGAGVSHSRGGGIGDIRAGASLALTAVFIRVDPTTDSQRGRRSWPHLRT
jgi:hypothetical protein